MFMPKAIKHERKIKDVLDHQLVNLRTYNQDPRAPAQDMAGLRSTYGYEKSKVTTADKMLKTRQLPMAVNAMPGLEMDKSEDKAGRIQAYPDFDSEELFIQTTDWLSLNIAGVLSQKEEGMERFLGCWGRKCNKYERHYSSAKESS